MRDFIEARIIKAIKALLVGRVNEIIRDEAEDIPIIEFGDYGCGYGAAPVVALSQCESTEKERIIRLDAYSITITFTVSESFESENQCYGYCAAVTQALRERPTLDGAVDRVVVTGTKYTPPKKPGCGDAWGLALTLRVTVEGYNV